MNGTEKFTRTLVKIYLQITNAKIWYDTTRSRNALYGVEAVLVTMIAVNPPLKVSIFRLTKKQEL